MSSAYHKVNAQYMCRGNQPWILIGRTDAETPILWPPDAKSQLIGTDPDAGKDRAGGKGDDRGWDGWMASSIQWILPVSLSKHWEIVKDREPGVLQSTELQRTGHDFSHWTTATMLLEIYPFVQSFSCALFIPRNMPLVNFSALCGW